MHYRESNTSEYKHLSFLDEKEKIELIQNSDTGELFVRKILTTYSTSIYEYFKENPVEMMPEILSVKEFGANDSSEAFLEVIEEYIHGKTVQEILDENGQISEALAIDIVRQTAEIVNTLHELSEPIVHRDIKPSNIIVTSDGQVFLLDVNAAKWVDSEKSRDTRLLGTVGYAAPEQYGFKSSDFRTDVYALGILLNVLVTGQIPSEKRIGNKLDKIVEKASAFSPEDRFQTVDEFIDAIERYLSFKKIETRRVDSGSGTKSAEESNSATVKRSIPRWAKFLPPGFRTLKPLRMVLSAFGYYILFSVTTALEAKGKSQAYNAVDSFFLTLVSVIIILFSANYLNIQERIMIKRIKSRLLRISVVVSIDVVLFVLAAAASGLIQMFFKL